MASRKAEKFDALKLLDWDDSELIAAYERGLKLRDDKSKYNKDEESSLKKKDSGKQWVVGDYCRAIYYEDHIDYEAKIIKIFDDYCTIVFLGYDEEVVVELNSLFESHGKSERDKQIRRARYFLCAEDSSCDTTITSGKHRTAKSKKGRSSCNPDHIPDQCLHNDTATKTLLHGHCGGPHCSGPSVNPNFIPPAPPIPQCLDAAQNSSLCAMLTSWYMAGYYTGLHQGQKGEPCYQRCCYHSNQSGNHH